jgi:hypothetical protein
MSSPRMTRQKRTPAMKSPARARIAAFVLIATWAVPNGFAQEMPLTSQEECRALLKAAESPDELVRLNAFTRIESQWSAFTKLAPQTLPQLIAIAYRAADADKLSAIRGRAAIILAGLTETVIEPNVPAVIQLVGQGNHSAAELLVRRREEQALPELLKRWAPSNGRDSLGNGLTQWLHSLPPQFLTQLTTHADPRVRRAMAKFFLESGQQGGDHRQLLASMWDDGDAGVATYALEGLALWGGGIHDPQGALERLIHGSNPDLARAALRASLKVVSDPATRLAVLLRDEDPRVRTRAAIEASDDVLADPAIAALFVHGVDSADADEARICCERLVTVHNADALPRLIVLACDPQSPNRVPAINALGALGEQAAPASPYLHLCLRHAEKKVLRTALASALGAIGPSAMHAVADLRAAFEPEKRLLFSVRCLEAISRIDPSAARTRWLLVKYAQLLNSSVTRFGQNLATVGPYLAKLGTRARRLAPIVAERLPTASASNAWRALDLLERMEAGDAATIDSLLGYAGRNSKAPIELRKRALRIVSQRCEDARAAQDALIALVQEGPEDVRPHALLCCAAIGLDRELLAPLVSGALESGRHDLAEAALNVVAQRRLAGDTILAGITAQLRMGPSDMAARALLALGDEAADAAPRIAELAATDDDARRLRALPALWSIGPVAPIAIAALQRAAQGDLERNGKTMASLALVHLQVDAAAAPAAHVERAAPAP